MLRLIFLRLADVSDGAGLGGGDRDWPGDLWGCGIFGNFLDHFALPTIEASLAGIPGCDAGRAEDEAGARNVDVVAEESVHNFHERELDGLSVLEISDGWRRDFSAYAADHPLMEITEDFLAQRWRATADAVDFDVSADASVWINRHGG